MTIFEKREWRKRRGISLTRAFFRREEKRLRTCKKIRLKIDKLEKQYETVLRRPYAR